MSKFAAEPRKTTARKTPVRSLTVDDRFDTDDEIGRRRRSGDDKQRRLLTADDIRRVNNQISILREILFPKREMNESMTRFDQAEFGSREKKRSIVARSTNGKNRNSLSTSNGYPSDEHSLDEGHEPIRPKRIPSTIRSSSLHCPPRSKSNSVSFMADSSKRINASSPQSLSKLLDSLWLELNDLESITGFRRSAHDTSNTCSAALVSALLALTGHVKQCARSSNSNDEIDRFSDQLSVIVKTQVEFQDKVERQMQTLQTMMQTVCQVVNHAVLTNTMHQDPTDTDMDEQSDHWSDNLRRTRKLKNNPAEALLTWAQRLNNPHSSYVENLEASKNVKRIAPSLHIHDRTSEDVSKPCQRQTNGDEELRSSTIHSLDIAPSYGVCGSDFFTNKSSTASTKETLLEKILQERLRLVQQMGELSKQHARTQEELADLEAKTIEQQTK